MTQGIRPVANSTRKVYIARTRSDYKDATPVSLSASEKTQGVAIVDDPRLATEIVAVHVGGNRLDRSAAKRLTKAALKDQKRQEEGKKEKGIFDQIVDDLSAPKQPAQSKKKRRGGSWAIRGMVIWVILMLAAMITGGLAIGVGLFALLITPIFGPIVGWIIGSMLFMMDDR